MFIVFQRVGSRNADPSPDGRPPVRFRGARILLGIVLILIGVAGIIVAIWMRPVGRDLVLSGGLIALGVLAILHALE